MAKQFCVKVVERYVGYIWVDAESGQEAEEKAPANVQTDFECTYSCEVIKEREKMNAEQFNEEIKEGADVIYTDDLGQEHATKTRSPAWDLSHGDALVSLEGRTGGYLIERVRAA